MYDLLHPTIYGKNTVGCRTYPAGRSQRAAGYVCHLYDKQTEEEEFEFECHQSYTSLVCLGSVLEVSRIVWFSLSGGWVVIVSLVSDLGFGFLWFVFCCF